MIDSPAYVGIQFKYGTAANQPVTGYSINGVPAQGADIPKTEKFNDGENDYTVFYEYFSVAELVGGNWTLKDTSRTFTVRFTDPNVKDGAQQEWVISFDTWTKPATSAG